MASNMLLAAADQVAAAATPTREIGTVLPARHFVAGLGQGSIPGWSVIEAQTQERIPVDALRWPKSVWTYEDMRRDSQIQGLLQSVWLPIRHMEWYLDPAGTTGTIAEEIAEDLGLPLLGDTDQDPEDGGGIQFDEHLRLALLAIALGHRYFEESGEIVGEGAAARYRLRRLSDRPNTSIARINILANGDLHSIWQHGAPIAEIPADRLVPYVWDREGGNWAGRPLLYSLYRNWLLKDQLVRADAVKHTRFNGVPIVETTDPSVGKEAHAEAALMAQLLQSGQGAGASTPYGTRLRLLGVEGTLPDTVGSIQYHDQQMARAFMQMFAELGNTAHGSRALGATLLDHYALGVLAIAHWARRSLMLLVRRIVARNYPAGTAVPKIGFRQEDHEDLSATELVALIDSGAIIVDDELEAVIRERGNLPERSGPGRTPTKAPAAARRRKPATAAVGGDDPATVSGTDFEALQRRFETALASAKAGWDAHRRALIDDLVAQVQAASSPADLAAVTVEVGDIDWLTGVLSGVTTHGAEEVRQAAATQGHTLTAADMAAAHATVADAAEGTATMLARALSMSAATKAVQLAAMPAEDRAQQVRDHLEGLTGVDADYELGGLVTKAQNTGRFAQMAESPDGTRYYASELNDTNTCEACAEVDGTEFESLDDAQGNYPCGYALCLGGDRCRGTAVAVYPEATPSA